jgi:hypothetical protein
LGLITPVSTSDRDAAAAFPGSDRGRTSLHSLAWPMAIQLKLGWHIFFAGTRTANEHFAN